MNFHSLKIGVQLKIGFIAMMLLVIVLGVASYLQTNRINRQTELMYNHPLKVRSAIGALEADVLNMRLGMTNLMLTNNEDDKKRHIQLIELSAMNAHLQFDILKSQYLGDEADIISAFKAFSIWEVAHKENVELVKANRIDEVKANTSTEGVVGKYRADLIEKLDIIDIYAQNKAKTLYENSVSLNRLLNIELILLIFAILFLLLVDYYILIKAIRNPINELIIVAQNFRKGNMSSRSSNHSENELGLLSSTFNALAENIQATNELNNQIKVLSDVMLSEDDPHKFFHDTLSTLSSFTHTQSAAVYLLTNDKLHFEHFESIGLSDNARKRFSAINFEGEFGVALSMRKVHYLKNIPPDSSFTFYTVSGQFIPCEIITIPIISGKEIIAVISLSSIYNYDKQYILLIDKILDTLSARIEGILSYKKNVEFSTQLESQNSELEAQKAELTSKSIELVEQNAELEMQKVQLDEASRLKTSFLSNMSHELRTPLNSVIALSGVLSRRLANKIGNEEINFLEVIERNGKNLLALINDILDISRIEAGKEELEITQFNLKNTIVEVVNMIRPQASAKDIELQFIESNSEISILSDAVKLRHILQNLVGNAVKFTEKGKVEIDYFKGENGVEIRITDTGIGISEEHISHIFDEFRQADGSTSRRFGGSGLGLAIAKKYANLLGGSISVTSSPNVGSIFTLTLPINYSTENSVVERDSSDRFSQNIRQSLNRTLIHSAQKTILLVEDSESVIIQLKDALDECGYNLLAAHNGAEALEIINHTIPDAMILDLMMPGVDGFTVLQTLRDAEPTAHIPVLILTAKHITKEELKFLKRNNIHQLIQKGDINRDDLLNEIETMVNTKPIENEIIKAEAPEIVGKPVVLVVEDNPDNMISVKAILADKYEVLTAIDGLKGVEIAKTHKPHLILMDIELPGMDGIEAFKTIRNFPGLQHIPIIALTASAMIQERETILAHGFDAYIAKPIDIILFFKTINEILYAK